MDKSKSWTLKVNSAIIEGFEKADLKILVFLLLALNYLSFTLSSNEEAYLPVAKQFMDHGWMPHSFLFNEWPGNQLVFQWISGFFLRYLSFENFAFFARLLTFILLSIPLAGIFKKAGLKNIYILIVFQIYLLHQNYFGQEFIFGDFESKSLAYIFVFAGVYYLLNNKYLLAVFFAAIAAYFHILAGGWFFVLLFIYTFFTTKSILLLLKQGFLFIIIVLPFAYYLAHGITSVETVMNGVNINWIYVYYRNPHHTAPLSVKNHLIGNILQIIATGLLFLSTLFIFRKFKGELLDKFYRLNVVVFSMLFISLAISVVDKTGFFLKFYLFRIAALGCFLMYLYLMLILKGFPAIPQFVRTLFFAIGFYLIIAASISTVQLIFFKDTKPEFRELVEYVQQNTSCEDVILSTDDFELSFSRQSGRELFVIFKNSGGLEKLHDWYSRIQAREAIRKDVMTLQSIKQKYKLDYLLTDHPYQGLSFLNLVFHNKKYYLYKIQ